MATVVMVEVFLLMALATKSVDGAKPSPQPDIWIPWGEEYDYIVAGGGSGGVTLARRISDDPSVRVLLLEAGGRPTFYSHVPMLAFRLQKGPLDWKYRTVPQKHGLKGFKNRQCNWPRGKVLGGTSILNFMIYHRGNRRDYDRWAEEGCYGWAWKDVLPYFLKDEDNRDPDIASNTDLHSSGGPLTVMKPPYHTPLLDPFLESGLQFYPQNNDLNGHEQSGFAQPQATVRDGARWSVVKAFLDPVLAANRSNLHILTFALVHKVLFEGNRAVGVLFEHKGKLWTVHNTREVIISAGTVGSPQILMLSGIGPSSHLQSLGIPVVSDLPVGDNLQDHVGTTGIHYTVNVSLPYTQVELYSIFHDYVARPEGPLTMINVDGMAFVHSSQADPGWPDLHIFLMPFTPSSDPSNIAGKMLDFEDEIFNELFSPYAGRQGFSLSVFLLRPKSRGSIRLRSADPRDHPLIDPNYLADERDVEALVEGMKILRKVGDADSFKKLDAKLFDTKPRECAHLEFFGDDYLRCFIRLMTVTMYHPAGTCKMGPPSDPQAVVDPELRVYGVHGLRVVDASIMPHVVSGNTNAPVIMIAEKAADLIAQAREMPSRSPPTKHNGAS